MANMTFKASLLPNTNLGYSLGSDTQKWNIYGDLHGNADTASKLKPISLNATTLNSEAGSFAYTGSGDPYAGCDWVGLQIGDSAEKWQLMYNQSTGHLSTRFNDSGGSNTSWDNWMDILDSNNYSTHLDGRYVTLTTEQNITGTKSWGTSGQGGQINGAATNGGLNSMRIGDDVWLGDCNAAGIMGMKSTSSNCGFYFYNSSGTQIGQLYSNGTNIISNKSIQLNAGNDCGIYFSGTQANYRMIRFIDNTGDTYGNGISIGGGGATIIGGGESANQAVAQVGAGSEVMYICNDGNIEFFPNLQNGWTTSYRNWIDTSGYYHGIKVYGAVWNDYAEMRCVPEDIEPGRCVKEIGDGSLILTTKRLERGCNIISDTYGFAIGETKTCKTPIAVSGRVLVYCYEGQEEAKKWIGYGVCSGPNGTVSIMTEEEERLYPNMIIGTISEIPEYNIWYAGNQDKATEIKVNGRIWIKVK